MINGNAVGGITGYGKTFILIDEYGNELTGVVVGEEVIFTADPVTDIREGKVAATDAGVVTGSKDIPAYHTNEGYRQIKSGKRFEIPYLSWLNMYDFTKLQVVICLYSGSEEESVSTEKVVINENVYDVQSTEVIATVVKDGENAKIDLGITNDSENSFIMRYFMYKETN